MVHWTPHRPTGAPERQATGHATIGRVSDLRARLAAMGIGLFDVAPEGPASPGDAYADLLVRLARSGDARLRAAIPCVLAAHDTGATTALRAAIFRLDADSAATLAFLYRIARCLVASRGPDLRRRGLGPELAPIPEEPAEIPDPEEMLGEMGPWVASELARERGAPDVAGDAASMFDLWLRLPEHEPA
jgi:hypothetical protein